MKRKSKTARAPKIIVCRPADKPLCPELTRTASHLNAADRIALAKKLSAWSAQLLESVLLTFDEGN
jgi:hypothetical protein